jgi:DNA processing protein
MNYQGNNISLIDRSNWVAIIGSRNASEDECNMAYSFAKYCVSKGKIVVSGLAKGIDAAAHKGAVDAGGKTIAIVNTPIEQSIYPKENRALAQKILENGMILHPFDSIASEMKEKGLNHFSKRLIERDMLLSFLTPVIVTVKFDSATITGGTKWGMNYGKIFDKKIYRLDHEGKLHENPDFERANIWWDIEINLENII